MTILEQVHKDLEFQDFITEIKLSEGIIESMLILRLIRPPLPIAKGWKKLTIILSYLVNLD